MNRLYKCVNCGATLTSSVCEYCGTHYDNKVGISGKFDGYSAEGEITIGDETIKCYISEVEWYDLGGHVGRDLNGRITRSPSRFKRRIRLVEV